MRGRVGQDERVTTGDTWTAFEAEKSAMTTGAVPSAGHDLLGMQMDFDAYWYGSDLLADATIEATGDAENMLNVRASAMPEASDDEIESELVRIWTERLRYGYRDAHYVTRTADAIVLHAVTQIGPDGFVVTATVTVHRS